MIKDDASRAIGKIVSVAADRLVVELHRGNDNFTVVGFDDIHYVAVLGSYLTVAMQAEYVVLEVVGLRERDNTPHQASESELDKTSSAKFLDVVPVGTMPISDGSFHFGVTTFPPLYSDALYAREEDLDRIFKVDQKPTNETKEDVSGTNQQGSVPHTIEIGTSAVFEDYPVKLRIDELFGGHVAVLGNTGSGKSCTVASIFQSVFMKPNPFTAQGASFLIFDVNGEYRQALNNIPVGIKSIYLKASESKTSIPNSFESRQEAETNERFTLPHWFMSVDEWALLLRASEKSQLPALRTALGLTTVFQDNSNEQKIRIQNGNPAPNDGAQGQHGATPDTMPLPAELQGQPGATPDTMPVPAGSQGQPGATPDTMPVPAGSQGQPGATPDTMPVPAGSQGQPGATPFITPIPVAKVSQEQPGTAPVTTSAPVPSQGLQRQAQQFAGTKKVAEKNLNVIQNHVLAKAILSILHSDAASPSKSNYVQSILNTFSTDEISMTIARPGLTIHYGQFRDGDKIETTKNFDKLLELLNKYKKDDLVLPSYENKPFSFEKLQAALELAIYYEEANGNKQIRDYCSQMVTRLKSVTDNPDYDFLRADVGATERHDLDQKHYIDRLLGISVSNGQYKKVRQICMIDLNDAPDEIVELSSAVIARLIFDRMRRAEPRNVMPVHLILEEAHRYISEKPRGFGIDANIVFQRIAKEGRKYGAFLIVASQRPSELSKTVLSQCNNFIIHRIQNPDDLAQIRQMTPFISETVLKRLPSLPKQHALIFGNSVNIPTTFRVRDANPIPNSNDTQVRDVWYVPNDPKVSWKP